MSALVPKLSSQDSEGVTKLEISCIQMALGQFQFKQVLDRGEKPTFKTYELANENNLFYVIKKLFKKKWYENLIKEYNCSNYHEAIKNEIINYCEDNLIIFVFNVGQGNFILVRHHNDGFIFDAGNGYNDDELDDFDDIFDKDLMIKLVVISHPHNDHFKLLPDFMRKFAKAFHETKFILSEETIKKLKSLKINDELKKRFGELPLFQINTTNNQISDYNGVKVSILNSTQPKGKGNKASLIVLLEYRGKKILFPGDSEGGESDLYEIVDNEKKIEQMNKEIKEKEENIEKNKKDIKKKQKRY